MKNDYMKIKLNKNIKQLNPKIKYVIDMVNEWEEVADQIRAIAPNNLHLLHSYHNWLDTNGFNSKSITSNPPTNEYVERYYGKQALWNCDLSQGIVVKQEGKDGNFYIIMQLKKELPDYKGTQIILTLDGCL